MRTSEQCNEIFKAMAIAQGEMNPAIKDSTNPHFKSSYADLHSVWNSIRTPLSKNGISVFQDVVTTQLGVSVTTILGHSSGQFMEFGPLEIPLTKRDAHGVGSGISYAKRYALCAILGVSSADEDDDGNSSVGFTAETPKISPKSPTISKEQVKVLKDLFRKCPSDYEEYIDKYLRDQNIEGLEKMPVSMFDVILQQANTIAKKAQNGQQSPE